MSSAEMVVKPNRVSLKGLPPMAFQHPLDLRATENLKKIKGFDWLTSKFVEYGVERIAYVHHVGGAIRVGPKQYAKHYGMLLSCCEILDVPEPELYVMQAGVNAYTSGHNHPFIVLETGLLELMEDDEVMAVIAHELGHIKCGHVLYKTMARGIKPLLEIAGKATLGVGGLVGASIEAGLSAWNRRSELSADRAALLVMQDAQPCITMLMKLAGGTERHVEWLDAEQFLNQARAYKEGLDDKMSDRFYRFIANMGTSHPFAVERARALDEWVSSPQYNQVLLGNYSGIAQLSRARVCPTCGQAAQEGDKFCSNDATPLPVH
jgi:Zn-dependent protease with chaperone function